MAKETHNNQDFEFFPQKLIADLKYDVEALKKKLSQPDTKIQELILDIESLKDCIHDLNNIFQKAIELSKDEDPTQKLQQLTSKIDEVVTQNETIAKGMIAISDKLENFMSKNQAPTPQSRSAPNTNIQHTMGMPALPRSRTAPPLNFEEPFKASDSMDLPPPPPRGKFSDKKRLIGGMFN